MSCRGGGPDLELKGWSNQWNLQRHVEKIICSFLIYQANTYSLSVYVQLSPVALTELLPVLQGTQSLNPHNDYCQHFVDTGHRPQNFIRDVGMSQPVTVWGWLILFNSTSFSSSSLIPYGFWEVQVHKHFLVFCLSVHTYRFRHLYFQLLRRSLLPRLLLPLVLLENTSPGRFFSQTKLFWFQKVDEFNKQILKPLEVYSSPVYRAVLPLEHVKHGKYWHLSQEAIWIMFPS